MPRPRTGSLELRNNGYHARITVTVDGKPERRWFRLDTLDKAKAKRMRDKLVAEIEAGRFVAEAREKASAPETVESFAWPWNESRRADGVVMWMDEKIHLRDFIIPSIGGTPLADLRVSGCQLVIDSSAAKGISFEYLRKIRGTLGRLVKEARRREILMHNPVELVRMAKRKKGEQKAAVILTDEEIREFMQHPDVDLELKMLAIVSRVQGGMRTGELNCWDWRHIQKPGLESCSIYRSKTDEWQDLEIPEMLRPFLHAWWIRHGAPASGPVFPVRRGERKGQFKATRGTSYARRLRRDLLRAGVTRHEVHHNTERTRRADFHSFRRAFASALARAGVNAQTAARLANHSDIKTHLRYVAPQREIPAAALPAIPAPIAVLPRAVDETTEAASAKNDPNVASRLVFAPVAQLDRASAFEGIAGRAVSENSTTTWITRGPRVHLCFPVIRDDLPPVDDSDLRALEDAASIIEMRPAANEPELWPELEAAE